MKTNWRSGFKTTKDKLLWAGYLFGCNSKCRTFLKAKDTFSYVLSKGI